MIRPRSSVGFWRGYVLGLATPVLLGLLWQFVSQPSPVYGQVPDSGAQRNRMVQELVTGNKKLSQITDLLKEIRDLNKGASPARKSRKASPPSP